MANITQKLYDAIVTLLTTELNTLTTTSYSAAGPANGSDATTAADLFADFELNVTFGTAPTVDTTLDLFLVRSVDGTNYPDGGGAVKPSSAYFVGSFPVRAVTTAQRIHIYDVKLPPGLFKAILLNNATGQSTAASGNTVKMRPFNMQSV